MPKLMNGRITCKKYVINKINLHVLFSIFADAWCTTNSSMISLDNHKSCVKNLDYDINPIL